MSRTKHEPPVRFVSQIMQRALDGAAQLDREHESSCPARQDWERQHSGCEPPPAPQLPFGRQRIPRELLTEIVERMSTSEWTVHDAAEEYGLPLPLLERELADFQAQYRRELLRRADPWDLRWRN